MSSFQTRTYPRAASIVFLKTNEVFGGLSNMASGFPVCVNGFQIRTCEALYQACRFPHRPDVQRRIMVERSPMTAKMRSKAFRKESRSDWDAVRVNIMRWCLRVKLAQNWRAFSDLLLKTADRPIVEQSRKDDFWGAKPIDERTLVGRNVLGRLLMELREAVKAEGRDSLLLVQPLAIPDFMLGGRPIGIVTAKDDKRDVSMVQTAAKPPDFHGDRLAVLQPSLFDVPVVNETILLAQPVVSKRSVGIANLKPYHAMEDSGVGWLGEVPAHWKVRKLRHLLRVVAERNRPDLPLLSVVREKGIIVRDISDKDENHNFIPDDLTNYKVVQRGNFAMNKMKAWQGSYGVSKFDGIVSPAYFVFSIDGVDSNYFHLAIRSKAYISYFTQASDGVRIGQWDLSLPRMREIHFSIPSPVEQTAIVRFLDHADQRIRRYIRAKQKLIALLEEQKQAIIHQAVTGQIDVRTGQPYPAYKSSGVKWLGEVPAHWSRARLKVVLSQPTQNGLFKKKDQFGFGVPLINVTDVYRERFNVEPSSLERVQASPDEARRFQVQDGDIFFVRSSLKLEGTGRSAIATNCSPDTVFECHLVQARPDRRRVNTRYLVVQLNSYALRHYLIARANVVTMATIAQGTISSCPVVIPPRSEQDRIVQWIDSRWDRINQIADHANREVSLLREYRTRLITDVVTGKLDVREAAATLPEVEPREAEDDPDDTLGSYAEAGNDELNAVPEEAQA